MLNVIKKLFQVTSVNVSQNTEAIALSKQELKAIVGAGQKIGTMGGGDCN